MINSEDLFYNLMMFGRANIQGLLTRSPDANDAIVYLRVEQGIELARATPFVTTNALTFERKRPFSPEFHLSRSESYPLDFQQASISSQDDSQNP